MLWDAHVRATPQHRLDVRLQLPSSQANNWWQRWDVNSSTQFKRMRSSVKGVDVEMSVWVHQQGEELPQYKYLNKEYLALNISVVPIYVLIHYNMTDSLSLHLVLKFHFCRHS